MKEIYKRLSEIQNNLKVPKEQRNSFGNYNFRSCEDILNAVKDELKTSEGECVLLNSELVQVSDRIYIKAIATFTNGSDKITTEAFAREPMDKKGMDDAQITGATLSYARKYALAGLFAIDNEKDADSNETQLKLTTSTRPLKQPDQPDNTHEQAIIDILKAGKFTFTFDPSKTMQSIRLENGKFISIYKDKYKDYYNLSIGTKDNPEYLNNFIQLDNLSKENIISAVNEKYKN